jgi:hypothetical protein
MQEDVARKKELKEQEAGSRKWKLKHRHCKSLTLGLDQITYTCALSSVYSLPCDNFVQKVVPQMEKLFVTAFKNVYVSRVLFRKIAQSLFHRQITRPWAHAFTWDLRFNPPLCNYSHSPSMWDLQFSSAYELRASTRKWGSQFRLGEVEPSFEEFLASPTRMHFQVLRGFLLLPQ